MVIVPYRDLLTAASYRIVDREQHRRAVVAVGALSGEAEALRKALEAERNATGQAMQQADMLRKRYNDCADDLLRRQQRQGRPNVPGFVLGAFAGAIGMLLLVR